MLHLLFARRTVWYVLYTFMRPFAQLGDFQIRWVHELRRFPDIDPLVLSPANSEIDFGGANVVVCSHPTIHRMAREVIETFHTIVVDKRFPCGLIGTSDSQSYHDYSSNAPLEFMNTAWWKKLSFSKSNRVVLEKDGSSFSYLRNTTNRQRLSIIALYMSFLLGTSVFESRCHSLEKSVLAWGRQRVKQERQPNKSKYQHVHSLLSSVCDSLQCHVEGTDPLSTFDGWTIRQCEMTESQRESYHKTCSDVRSKLAWSASERSDEYDKVVRALMELRKQVFHSNLSRCLHLLGPTPRASSSQTDADVANQIATGSGKLKSVVALLVQDFKFKYDNDCLDSLLSELEGQKRKSSKHDVRSVVILASHPDIRRVLSGFFGVLGIDHDVLGANTNPKHVKTSSLHSQMLLSKFNSSKSGIQPQRVLIACPRAVGNDLGGLGIGSADAVVSIDESWSGAEELLLYSLISRIHYQRRALDSSPCAFYRFVAKGTCESRFLEQKTGKRCFQNEPSELCWVSPVLHDGLYGNPIAQEKNKGCSEESPTSSQRIFGSFSFPGRTLFRFEGDRLIDYLVGSEEEPSFFLAPMSAESSLFGELSHEQKMLIVSALQVAEQAVKTRVPTVGSTALGPKGNKGTPPLACLLDSRTPCWYFLRSFVERGKYSTVYEQSGSPTPSNQSLIHGLIGPSMQRTPSDVGVTAPTQLAADVDRSILFYKPDGHAQLQTSRSNFFSASFSADRDENIIYDGNQGTEPLIYFPPLFPRLLECAKLAGRDVFALQTQIHPPIAFNGDVGSNPTGHLVKPAEVEELSDSQHRVVFEDEASRNDAASVLIDISDDFGLAGMGAVPLPHDSAISASFHSVHPGVGSITEPFPTEWSEFQEIENVGYSGVDSMLLLTSKKRSRKTAGGSSGHETLRSSFNGSQTGPMNPLHPVHQGPAKKLKTGTNVPMRSSITGISLASHSSNKDAHLHNLLRNLRQYGRRCMFEAPIYRVASARLRHKIFDRLPQLSSEGVAYETGPGLPLIVSKQQQTLSARGYHDPWTSIVKRLSTRDATSGSEAIELSIGQRNLLRRSLISPCRVDFGPFQSGFFSSIGGETVGSPQRPRVGVSLPMGVKIAPSSKDQLPLPWTQDDDRRLHEAAVRTGMNWILTAAELSGFKDITVAAKSESRHYHLSRSARTCRDRWQRLARTNPAMIVKVRQSDRCMNNVSDFPESDTDTGRRLESPNCTSTDGRNLLLSSRKRNKEPPITKRRTFHAVRTAKVRHQPPPPTQIPGVTPGAQPTTSTPHQSHDQAIRTSVAASWTGGRIDMWPLHLLDAADSAEAATRHSISSSARAEPPSNRR